MWVVIIEADSDERNPNWQSAELAPNPQHWPDGSYSVQGAVAADRGERHHEAFGSERLTGALLDRLTHHGVSRKRVFRRNFRSQPAKAGCISKVARITYKSCAKSLSPTGC
jgi:hypothetical protein